MNTQGFTLVGEVNFVPIKPQNGLVGFASCVFSNAFYLGSIAVHTRANGGIRLVYPRQKGVDVFHPISSNAGKMIEDAVMEKYKEIYP